MTVKRGRKGIADLTAPVGIQVRAARLKPPPHLTEDEAEIFRELVLAVDPSHFAASDLPILCTYCQAIALGRRASAALAAGDFDMLQTFEKASRLQVALSARLRLCPQSRAPDPRTLDRQARRQGGGSVYDEIIREGGE